jgi:uncharacterized protein (DUF1684 family)
MSVSAQSYTAQLQQWHAQRIAELKSPQGWLNLVGLLWLEEGTNRFGTAAADNCRFPKGTIAAHAGRFIRNGLQVIQVANPGVSLYVDGVRQDSALVFDAASGVSHETFHGSLRWKIIRREDKLGIRLRDMNSTQLKHFKGIPRFTPDPSYRVMARLERPIVPQTIKITNVLGQTTATPSPGKLFFELKGRSFVFDTMEEEGKLFIVFGDLTSGKTTYPSGRFLYAAMPGEDGMTRLDFNQSINPPCAFTPYATCPLPPRQNILPIAVRAGEQYRH